MSDGEEPDDMQAIARRRIKRSSFGVELRKGLGAEDPFFNSRIWYYFIPHSMQISVRYVDQTGRQAGRQVRNLTEVIK